MNYDQTVWEKDKPNISFSSLSKDDTADVVIIGAGITGITTAYFLTKAGKKVIVVDEGEIGGYATSHTTAFLTQYIDEDISELINEFGRKKTKQIWDSHAEAIDIIESIIKIEKIDCEFQRTKVRIFANNDEEKKSLLEEEEIAKKNGYPINFIGKKHLGFSHNGFLEISNQAKFHPLKFVLSLAEKTKADGTKIYNNTKVEKIEENETLKVVTRNGTITTQLVISATHLPFHHHKDLFALKGKYYSYAYALKIPKDFIEESLYWDTYNPYHYFRIDKKDTYDRMIIGGEDHRADLPINPKKNFTALKKYISDTFPDLKYELITQWYGPIIETADRLAYIGEIKPNYFLATGFSGNGMTYGVISAIIFRDLLLKKENPSLNLYSPKRIPSIKQIIKVIGTYSKEFLNGYGKNIFKNSE